MLNPAHSVADVSEQPDLAEQPRRTFSVSAAGRVVVFDNQTGADVVLLELVVLPVVANTIQLFHGDTALTPVWDLDARQPYHDTGGLLIQANSRVVLATGGAGLVVGMIRWRYKRTGEQCGAIS